MTLSDKMVYEEVFLTGDVKEFIKDVENIIMEKEGFSIIEQIDKLRELAGDKLVNSNSDKQKEKGRWH